MTMTKAKAKAKLERLIRFVFVSICIFYCFQFVLLASVSANVLFENGLSFCVWYGGFGSTFI